MIYRLDNGLYFIYHFVPSQVFLDNDPLILSKELKFVTWNTCVASGSVAIAFNSERFAPEPTPMEKTVMPAFRSKAASEDVAAALFDWPVNKEMLDSKNCYIPWTFIQVTKGLRGTGAGRWM